MQEWFVKKYFNTSYVMVQPIIIGGVQKFTNHFNTSYVMVQRVYTWRIIGRGKISIHLMLWFNIEGTALDSGFTTYFNTSYVMVQQ